MKRHRYKEKEEVTSVVKAVTDERVSDAITMVWRLRAVAAVLVVSCWAATSTLLPLSPVSAAVTLAGNEREQTTGKKLLCYFSLSSHGQRPLVPLPPDALNVTLCTHIVISSAVLRNTTIVPRTAEDIQVYKELVSLRKQHPDLQVLVRVEGNWTHLTHDRLAAAVFAYNAGKFLQKNGLGGMEVAWQPPSWPPQDSGSAQGLSLLLLQLNSAIKLASHPPFLLSVAVSSSQRLIDQAYDIRVLNRTVDFVSVATYDFHTYQPNLPFTGYGAPLRPREAEQGHWATLNTQWAIRYWLRKGLPREKLVLTIPTFANTWKLLSSAWTKVGAPAIGLGMMGGRMTYPQVCVFVQRGSAWKWDEASEVPYAWRSREWVSYEDAASVREKAKLVMTEDLAGAAVLDLNSDDWAGLCSRNTTFPLLKAAWEVLSKARL